MMWLWSSVLRDGEWMSASDEDGGAQIESFFFLQIES